MKPRHTRNIKLVAFCCERTPRAPASLATSECNRITTAAAAAAAAQLALGNNQATHLAIKRS